jgi:outer membrane protein TolC
VHEACYRLYLLDHLIRINQANRQLARSLLDTATSRVRVGDATAGDVVLGTLELSRIEEERLMLQQQLVSRRAVLNQLLNRPSDSALAIPTSLDSTPVEQTLDELRVAANQQQPEIVAARLRSEAAAWGIDVAQWQRVPDLTLSYEQMFMKMNPGESGSDSWQVGAGINVPIWHHKYAAMRREAAENHLAASASLETAVRTVDTMLLDYLEQTRTARRTVALYRNTILPQARQALEADQRAYGLGAVTFERVVNDARNLLTAEATMYRAMADKAIAIARLTQTIGGGRAVSEVRPQRVPEEVPPPD